jgi:hypothetical protein
MTSAKPPEIAVANIHDNPLLNYSHVIVTLMRQRAIKIVKQELAAQGCADLGRHFSANLTARPSLHRRASGRDDPRGLRYCEDRGWPSTACGTGSQASCKGASRS